MWLSTSFSVILLSSLPACKGALDDDDHGIHRLVDIPFERSNRTDGTSVGIARMTFKIHYIARAFAAGDKGPSPLEAITCFNAQEAVSRAEALSLRPGHIAAIAYSIVDDDGTCEPVMLRRFGVGAPLVEIQALSAAT